MLIIYAPAPKNLEAQLETSTESCQDHFGPLFRNADRDFHEQGFAVKGVHPWSAEGTRTVATQNCSAES
jgi:hypothetical protein